MKRNHLYGWVFTYNPYQDMWSATSRENYKLLFNGTTKGDDHLVLRSRDIKTLQSLIMKIEGDIDNLVAVLEDSPLIKQRKTVA